METERLSEAFQNFTAASKSLETYYELLRDRVRYLTAEIEMKNRQLHEALTDAERNREYLKAILYNLEEAIIVLDREDKITLINKSAERLLHIDPLDAEGRYFGGLDLEIRGNGSETFLTVKGKRYDIILSRSKVIHRDNRPAGSVILIKDVTRLRELETQQERNERLIAMGEMSAKIVHEIRNPLCSIELFAGMLEKEVREPSQRDLARGISTGIHNLNNILKNMLFFARPNRPVMKPLDVFGLIEDSLALFGLLMESRKIELKKSIFQAEVLGDGELLKQVFMNILINAIQSMPEGGSMKVTMKTEEDTVVVNIEDSGAGIEPQDLEKIFNPFFSTKETGTGLGLAIASMIMQRHGGFIKATSEAGKGSTFSLYFKMANGDGSRSVRAEHEIDEFIMMEEGRRRFN